MKIGVFDSGLGGKFALEKIQALLPTHQYETYFDHDNAPYGEKSSEEIYQLTEKGCQALWEKNCQLILIACNTASAQALRVLQEKYSEKKILGCLIPAIEEAIDQGGKKIGLIATSYTIETKKYHREAFKINQKIEIFGTDTPKLVRWIEAGKQGSPELEKYLNSKINWLIKNYDIDTLILGCTHYSVLQKHCQQNFPNLNIIDSAEAQTIKLKGYLERHTELQ